MGAKSDQMILTSLKETTFGTAATGTGQNMRFTSENLKLEESSAESEEIESSRMLTELLRLSLREGGDVSGEFSYATYDSWLEAVLLSADWTTEVSNAISVSFADTDNSINRAAGDFTSDGYLANSWLKTTGSVSNNGTMKMTSVATLKIIVSHYTITTESAVSTTMKMGAEIKNSTTFRSHTIEKEYTDLTTTFTLLTGMIVDRWALGVNKEAKITTTFGFVGKTEDGTPTTSSFSSKTAVNSNPIYTTASSLGSFMENGVALGITSFTLEYQNQHRLLLECFESTASDAAAGSVSLTGTLQTYFTTRVLAEKFRVKTETAFVLMLKDTAGGSGGDYVIEMPRTRFSGLQQPASAKNQDLLNDGTWTAMKDSTESIVCRIVKWAA